MKETTMDIQQTLVNARIEQLQQAANDARRSHGDGPSRTSQPARIRLALGQWLVNFGMALMRGVQPRTIRADRY
jgi:hypothetical protein